MFCFHKYGVVQQDGYQYCKKCGKALNVPCNHIWENINMLQIKYFKQISKIMYISKCTKCGTLKTDRYG